MRRKRVAGRFYIFLLAILLIAFLIIRPHLHFGSNQALIVAATASYAQKTDAIIIRDEEVYSSANIARVEYIANEGTLLNEGDTVAYLYSTGYSEDELESLDELRANIPADPQTILIHLVVSDLDRLARIVDMQALEL